MHSSDPSLPPANNSVAAGLSPATLAPPARILDGLAVAVLIAVAIVAAFTFRNYGLGWDDFTHSQYGELLLAYYASGFSNRRALSFVNLYMYGGGFDLAGALASKVLPFSLFDTRRLVGAAVGLIGLIATWRLGRRLGGPFAGLIALILLAACPMYYGHMFMNAKDTPFAVAMVIMLLGMARAIEDYPKPSPMTTLVLGLGVGLAIGTRVVGGLGALYFLSGLTIVAIDDLRMSGFRAAISALARFLFALLPALLLAYAVMAVVWPWSVADPLNPLRAVGYFSKFFEEPWEELFGGRIIAVSDMPRSYLPTLLALKLPLIFLLLGFGGAVLALIFTARRATPAKRTAVLFLILLAAFLPIAIAVVTRPAMYNSIRHFIFILPPLAALGGLAAAWLYERLPRPKVVQAAAAAIFAFLLASPVVEMVRLHPYQYTYFNRIAGRVAGADPLYMLDYWGLSLRQASEGLLEKLNALGLSPPQGRKWVVSVCGPHPPVKVVLGDAFETTWEATASDFAIMLGEFYCAELDAPLLLSIERKGVVYARVYDVRGRTFPTLFAEPPVSQ